jgi:two-component SAPR family response regulator
MSDRRNLYQTAHSQETPDLFYQAYLMKPISGGELKHHVEKYTQPEVALSAD